MSQGIQPIPRWACWCAVLISILLAACSQPEVPADRYYRISTTAEIQAASSPRLDGILMIDRFLADALVTQRSLVYGQSSTPQELLQYNYHYWTDSPTRMLQELLTPYLRAANVATEVITPELRVSADYELLGKIKRLEQLRGETPVVVVELEFSIHDARNGSLLWLENYIVEQACQDESILSAVQAFNQAVSKIFQQLASDLSGS